MTTVTAKELRQNLSSYLDRLAAGEEFAITRRSEIIGKLKPTTQSKQKTTATALAALDRYRQYLRDNNVLITTDPSKSTKELYHEMLDEKYGRYSK